MKFSNLLGSSPTNEVITYVETQVVENILYKVIECALTSLCSSRKAKILYMCNTKNAIF